MAEPSADAVIAGDSVRFHRSHSPAPGKTLAFHGLLSVLISYPSAADFRSRYEQVIDELFKVHELERLKRVYKAHEIYKTLAGRPRLADAFVHQFARRLLETDGLKVTANHGTFDVTRLASEQRTAIPADTAMAFRSSKVVPIYGRSPGRTYISPMEFLGLIEGPFHALAAWKLCDVTGIHHQTFLLDHFQGRLSKAWDELIERNRVYLVPQGDNCNPCIASADLLLRAIDRQMARDYAHLDRAGLESTLATLSGRDGQADVHVHGISNPDIPMIAPYAETLIPAEQFVKHPILFVVNEDTHPGERVELENSPLMRTLLDRAYSLGGSVMFYRPDTSSALIKDGDWLVYYGPRGKEAARRLKRFGHRINVHAVEGEGQEADTGS